MSTANAAASRMIHPKWVNRRERLAARPPCLRDLRERLRSDRRGAISALNPKSGLIVVRAP